jgi:hypothetical protein
MVHVTRIKLQARSLSISLIFNVHNFESENHDPTRKDQSNWYVIMSLLYYWPDFTEKIGAHSAAMHSISILASNGKAATWYVARAGAGEGKSENMETDTGKWLLNANQL